MKRRTVLASLAALPALSLPALATGTDYTPGLIETALAEGKTVFVDYAADWCSTCAKQERVINALRDQNPKYDANILFVRVDWDAYGNAPVSTSRKIPRRSTLIVLKGDKELGRIVAGTSEADIKTLLDTALTASMGA
ncbi:thioredoxin family protein [Phaeobacter marinintestinus]|uniref:thioredoxin family protein n=1 Tax=Falsiphaeobacter marinintestinus TaxID=1492905 RepID=UPI0011B7538E|nr:thioredoxin family protein [Phaeobacter marinintestinus]